jgi:hypothetical protein
MRYGFKLAAINAMDGWGVNHIDPLINAGVPPVVMSIDSAGPVYEAQEKMRDWPLDKRRAAALVYRHSEFDIPEYQLEPRIAAEHQWNYHVLNWPKELDRKVVWFGIVNEPAYVLGDADLPGGGGPYRTKFTHNGLQVWDNAEWLAVHAYRLAELAALNGIRLHLLGWSAGTPEPFQWKGMHMTKLLNVMRARPDDLALDLHEGSMNADSLEPGVPYLIGRFRNIPKPWPSIFVTEFGWALNDAPPPEVGIPQLEAIYADHYAYPQVKGLAIWALAKGASWGGLGQIINGYIKPLTERILAVDAPPLGEPPEPPPVEPPDEPPTEPEPLPMTNLLLNPSFEDGWTDATAFPGQHPKGWTVLWNGGEAAGGYGYLIGEAVHKSKALLPEAERDVFIWDGQWSFKVFAASRAIWPRLKQSLDLPAGRYKLTTPVWTDCYRWIGYKDYSLDADHIGWMVKVNGEQVNEWASLTAGGRVEPSVEFDHGGGALELAVHFQCRWPVSSNNLWLDDWSLVAVKETIPEPPPPPPTTEKHMAVVVKLPQGATIDEWRKAAEYAHGYQHTMTASHDDMLTILDGGNEESYVKLAYPDRQVDVAELITDEGYSWEPLFYEPPAPEVADTFRSPVGTDAEREEGDLWD